MTRSIVGRFLILAVLLVSLGVITQAALIISKGSAKGVAKADAAPAHLAVAAATPAPPPAPTPAPSAATPSPAPQAAVPAADGSTVRVVYPGPIGDETAQPRKSVAAAAPLTPPAPAAPSTPAPVQAAPQAAIPSPPPAAPEPAKPAPVVVASADAGTQPTAPAPAAARGGVNLNNASVEALNRLGGGHIGQTIVKHRPYGSIEDLVKKRVVRRSVYEHIKNQIAAE